jgi:hypothetical protein
VFDEWPDVMPTLTHLQICHRKSLQKNPNTKLWITDHSESNWDRLPSDQLLITNNIVHEGVLPQGQLRTLPNSVWASFYSTAMHYDAAIKPRHAYNCFINRMDPTRQSWLYQLIRRNLFDLGLVSFNMDISRHVSLGQYLNTAQPLEIFDDQFEKHCKIFQTEHDYIRSKIPFRNFDDSNLNNVIMQTKFSLVLETYFDDNRYITYSEKIFRCLKLPRPWLMFAMKGAVSALESMGFDVLRDVVDHSYDSIDFCIDRQVAILDLCQHMINIEYTPALQQRLQQSAQHNQLLLDQLKQSWHNDCTNFFTNL